MLIVNCGYYILFILVQQDMNDNLLREFQLEFMYDSFKQLKQPQLFWISSEAGTLDLRNSSIFLSGRQSCYIRSVPTFEKLWTWNMQKNVLFWSTDTAHAHCWSHDKNKIINYKYEILTVHERRYYDYIGCCWEINTVIIINIICERRLSPNQISKKKIIFMIW